MSKKICQDDQMGGQDLLTRPPQVFWRRPVEPALSGDSPWFTHSPVSWRARACWGNEPGNSGLFNLGPQQGWLCLLLTTSYDILWLPYDILWRPYYTSRVNKKPSQISTPSRFESTHVSSSSSSHRHLITAVPATSQVDQPTECGTGFSFLYFISCRGFLFIDGTSF